MSYGWRLSRPGNFVNAYFYAVNQDEYISYLTSASVKAAEECAIYDIRSTLTYLVTSSLRNASWEKYGEGIFSRRYCNNGTSYTSIDEDIIKIHYDSRVNNLDYEDLLIIEILIEHTSPIENVSIAFFDPFSESIYSEFYKDELIKIDDKTSKAVLSAYLLKEDLGNSRKRLSTSESAAEIYLYDQVFNHRLSTVHIISGNTKDSLWTDSYNLANGISFPLPTRCGSLGQHEIKNIDYENLLINTNF